jgi:hypothetical protein
VQACATQVKYQPTNHHITKLNYPCGKKKCCVCTHLQHQAYAIQVKHQLTNYQYNKVELSVGIRENNKTLGVGTNTFSVY